ncbi:MAG: DUF4926 domain-containing protein [Longimicrobiales bacterium]|nr:DUF4926 domain-containing protein [Longimicrobiales bacterium]
MIGELDRVVITRDIPDHGLAEGDLGTVVFRYPDGRAYEVEFMTGNGATVAVLTLDSDEVRSIADGEILHARRLRPV